METFNAKRSTDVQFITRNPNAKAESCPPRYGTERCLQRLAAVCPSRTFAVCLLLLVPGVLSKKASAQVPELLQIISHLDPYNVTEPAFRNATCSSTTCRLTFPPVPPGKRLFITGVSLNTFGSSTYLDAVLTNGVVNYAATDYHQINLPGGIVAKNDNSGFGYVLSYSGLVSFFIEPGYSPTFVYNGSVLTNDFAGQATITGFLVPKL